MATISENVFIVNSKSDLEAEMCRYNCFDTEELEDVLWNNYGVVLILNFK